MDTKLFFVVHSNYDNNGRKNRFASPVVGEVFTHKGHCLGIYYDREDKLWKLIDVLTGKQIASDSDKDYVLFRIKIKQVYNDYELITMSNMYSDLRRELLMLIDDYIKTNGYILYHEDTLYPPLFQTMSVLVDIPEELKTPLKKEGII